MGENNALIGGEKNYFSQSENVDTIVKIINVENTSLGLFKWAEEASPNILPNV